jgi:serine/threonine protein kinase
VTNLQEELEHLRALSLPPIIPTMDDSLSPEIQRPSQTSSINLIEFLGTNDFDVLIAADIFFQVLQGMKYLHTQNIVYLNLQPATVNITVDNQRRVTLNHFHHAKILPKHTDVNTKMTVQDPYHLACKHRAPHIIDFMPREGLENEIGFKSDSYSVACFLYYLYKRSTVFPKTMTYADKIQSLRDEQYPPVHHIQFL